MNSAKRGLRAGASSLQVRLEEFLIVLGRGQWDALHKPIGAPLDR